MKELPAENFQDIMTKIFTGVLEMEILFGVKLLIKIEKPNTVEFVGKGIPEMLDNYYKNNKKEVNNV